MEVAAGVHRLTQGIVNWYVIADGGKLVLVDAGAPRDWNLFVTTVGTLGHRLLDVDACSRTRTATTRGSPSGPGRLPALPGHGEPWKGGVPDAVRAARAAGPS